MVVISGEMDLPAWQKSSTSRKCADKSSAFFRAAAATKALVYRHVNHRRRGGDDRRRWKNTPSVSASIGRDKVTGLATST